jgi:splicing factor U2AF subunit
MFPLIEATERLKRAPDGSSLTADEMQKELLAEVDDFYVEVFEELSRYGEIDDLLVCANIAHHLAGNVMVKYRSEDDAEQARLALNGRYYEGRPLRAEVCPVKEFSRCRCRQYDETFDCARGDFCNFVHAFRISKRRRRNVFDDQALLRRARRDARRRGSESEWSSSDNDGQGGDRRNGREH